MTIVVIGGGSMVAQALRRNPVATGWRYLSHGAALDDLSWVADVDCVVNLAFEPRLKNEPYQETLDIDARLARVLSGSRSRYLMASTRMAYGPPDSDGRLTEVRAPHPVNHYGRAKLAAERSVAGVLGDRATILRLSNIFDFSEANGERRSFFGMALRRLRTEGQIMFDMSPFVARDFLPASLLAAWLVRIVENPRPGLFNLGAGFAVPAGRIAQWLIAGYGSGTLLISDLREHDGFWLDTAKACGTWGLPAVTERDIQDSCVAIGASIRPVR